MTQNITAHNLGVFPIGADPKLKAALEAFGLGNINQQQLEEVSRQRHQPTRSRPAC